jgi:hypothetical protein
MAQKRTSKKKTDTPRKPDKPGIARDILQYGDRQVVVDTVSHFIFLGKLEDVTEHFIALRDADVHDRRESPSMNEKYVLDAKKFGVRVNRKRVHIRLEEVISISLLDDVIEY